MRWIVFVFLLLTSQVFGRSYQDESYSFRGKNYSISYELKKRNQVIYLKGVIHSSLVEDHEGLKKVVKFIRPGVDVTLKLNSGGGLMSVFNDFSESLQSTCASNSCDITTYVESEDECASACVSLFMVGSLRKAGSSARFGFHTAGALPKFVKIPGMIQKDLVSKGVDEGWVARNKHLFTDHQVTILNPRDLDGSNIVDVIVEN